MKQLRVVCLIVIALSLISSLAAAQTPQLGTATYDAARDWSAESNPNGVWSYGYLSSWGAPFTLDAVEGGTVAGTSAWWPSVVGTAPVVSHNDTQEKICALTWCFKTHLIGMHPGPNGELSVLRWTAPDAGNYLVQANFAGSDWYFPTSTNVYVVLNSKRVFLKAPITSYDLPLTFNPAVVRLDRGATLDFMVDWGNDRSYIGDSTTVEVKIWKSM